MRLEYVILGLLAMRPFSGYDIRKWMEGPGQYLGYGAQLPQIYRALSALIDKGWVEFSVDPRDGKPDAKIYRLSEVGRAALVEWARSPFKPSSRPMDPDFNLRFVFAGQLGRDIAIDVLRTELDYRLAQAADSDWMGLVTARVDPVPEIDEAWSRQIRLAASEKGHLSSASYVAWLRLTLSRFELEAGLPLSRPLRPSLADDGISPS
jgi:DNA-binding PadR family transcriptional regulator